MATSVVIADDQALCREGLAALITATPEYTLADSAGDASDALKSVEKLHPDILLLDTDLSGMDSVDCCRTLKRRCRETHVLALFSHNNWHDVHALLDAGADGFVLKDSGLDVVLTAMHEACCGHRFIDPALTAQAIGSNGHTYPSPLSPREVQVAHLLANGGSNANVAEQLNISIKTVETHRARVFTKLQINNITQLVKFAIREGWTTLD